MAHNISPIDNRYKNKCEELRDLTSDFGINKIRYEVELRYLRMILNLIFEYDYDKSVVDSLVNKFSIDDFTRIKEYERITNHDIKALEYFIKAQIQKEDSQLLLNTYIEFVHFALTSQDINSVTNTLVIKRSLEDVIIPKLDTLLSLIDTHSKTWSSVYMMSKTHGQPAVTTSMGKEFYVFYTRLEKQIQKLKTIEYTSKFGGAVGNMNAHYFCYDKIDWSNELTSFLKDEFNITRNLYTTQVDHYDNLGEIFDILKRINTILIDFNQDIWLYISQNYFKLKVNSNETGSSTMPHKVNPINFENSEGNIHVANSLLSMFSSKLPISRLQRDLTDSTISRNFGSGLSYCLIAYNSLIKGLLMLEINQEVINSDLDNNYCILMEAVQCVMKTEFIENSYEIIKRVSRGKTITKETYKDIVSSLGISDENKKKLLELTPQSYSGPFISQH